MYKVLLVDDEQTILEGLSLLIDWERYGLQISAKASDGQKAIEILESTEIHILITDIKMPNLDGLELIHYIRNHKLNIKCIILSGYDDFTFVKEAAKLGIENYILKPVDENELIQTLGSTVEKLENEMYEAIKADKGMQILRENILNRWIEGNISENELSERLHFFGINLAYPYYAVSVLKIFSKIQISNDKYNHIKEILHDTCNSSIDKRIHCEVFYDQNENIVVIYFLNSRDSDYNKSIIYTSLNRCLESCSKIYGNVAFYAATGSIVNNTGLVSESYLQASELMLYGLLPVKERVAFYDDKKTQWRDEGEYLANDLRHLEQFIQTYDMRSAMHSIDKMYDQLQMAVLESEAARNITLSVIYHIMKMIEIPTANIGLLLPSYSELFANFNEAVFPNDFKEYVKHLLSKRMELETANKRGTNPMVEKMLDYIHSKYNMNINLNTVSEELDMNPVYLGHLFKSETGMRFSDYHNKYRINKAKKLLITTNMKTNDIMEKVGYVNLSYFYTIFKKVTGLSVAEFKQKMMNSDQLD